MIVTRTTTKTLVCITEVAGWCFYCGWAGITNNDSVGFIRLSIATISQRGSKTYFFVTTEPWLIKKTATKKPRPIDKVIWCVFPLRTKGTLIQLKMPEGKFCTVTQTFLVSLSFAGFRFFLFYLLHDEKANRAQWNFSVVFFALGVIKPNVFLVLRNPNVCSSFFHILPHLLFSEEQGRKKAERRGISHLYLCFAFPSTFNAAFSPRFFWSQQLMFEIPATQRLWGWNYGFRREKLVRDFCACVSARIEENSESERRTFSSTFFDRINCGFFYALNMELV